MTRHADLQPKRRTAAPAAEGGRLELSPPETLDAVLAQLQCNRRTLEVWTGRLREWLAHDLLQPLAAIIKHGHKARPSLFRHFSLSKHGLTSGVSASEIWCISLLLS